MPRLVVAAEGVADAAEGRGRRDVGQFGACERGGARRAVGRLGVTGAENRGAGDRKSADEDGDEENAAHVPSLTDEAGNEACRPPPHQ